MGSGKRGGQFLLGFDAKTPCGIYRIVCTANGKYYIGSSIKMVTRCSLHRIFLRKGEHHCLHLQRCWHKYGEDAFRFEVVLVCEETARLEKEQQFLDAAGPELLNASRRADCPESTPEIRKGRSERAHQMHAAGRLGQGTWKTSAKEKGAKAKATRLANGGYVMKPESVAKMKATFAAKPWTPERRAAQAERMAAQRAAGQKMSTKWTPERRAAQSERAKTQGFGGTYGKDR